MSRCDVISICAHAAADNFGIDVCAASLGVLEFLKHEGCRSLSDYEPVARAAEGAGCALGVVIAG